MDGIHDLGGREGFGPVKAERDEPVFHADWERRAFGVTFGTFVLGISNGGEFRHAIERMDPVHYLTSRYYEHWLTGVATRLVETGTIAHDELEGRAGGSFPLSRPEVAVDGGVTVDGTVAEDSVGDRLAVGDRVRARQVMTRGHTRCPGYVRGRAGTVVRIDPDASLPDVEAHARDRCVEPTYCVRFDASDLWGRPGDPVHVDLWRSYLERA